MTDSPWLRDAHALYTLLAEGGLALAPTGTGYGLVAMRGDAVDRIYRLKGRPLAKPCVTVGSMAVLDDVAVGIDAVTRAWIDAATRQWPLAFVARQNRRSTLLARTEPRVVAQCTKDGTIATFFGVGPLVTAAAALALRDGHVIVGSSANASGTGNAYRLEDVPAAMRAGVDRVFAAPAPVAVAGPRLASTMLDLQTGTCLRHGVAHDAIMRSWSTRAPAASVA